jgi:NAD(P)-dependent dehydrogenase (short-subunit alcohol dehydrogenase family)
MFMGNFTIFAMDFRHFMRKILVTGGAGNVGGALVEKLVQDKTNFVVVVR